MHKIDLNTTPTQSEQATVDSPPVSSDNDGLLPANSNIPKQEAQSPMARRTKKAFVISSIVAVLAGVITGFGGYQLMAKTQSPVGPATQPTAGENIAKGAIFGSQDTDAFKDSAEGYLEKGGLEGEGSHHLLRPGGESQTVYLTSSVTDLDALAGMEVKIWGETFKGQKAGWLMDVGRIEVLNPKGEMPTEE